MQQLGNFAQRFAGHDEAQLLLADGVFLPDREAVAVDADEADLPAADLKERAGVDRLGVGLRDGEDRLPDHALEQRLRERDAALIADRGEIGVFVRGNADDREFARAALDSGDVLVVHGDLHGVARQAAHNVAEEAGAQHDGAFLRAGGLDRRRHAEFEIIAAQRELCARGPQENALERGNGGFCGDRPLNV